jgi:predicted Rossmann fold flavoprotein
LANFGIKDVLNFFHAEGVQTKVEETGKIFPVSDRALDVLNALLARLARSGVQPTLAEPAIAVEPAEGHGFRITTPKRSVTCEHLLITTGGLSYPGCGTTGDGYGFAQRFGHSIVRTRPALVPLTLATDWIKELQGVTLPDVGLKVVEGNKALSQRRGSLLFAHFGLSGPAPLDVSRAISGHAEPRTLNLQMDLVPEVNEQLLDQQIADLTHAHGKQLLAGVLAHWQTRRICDAVVQHVGLAVDRRAAALARADRLKLVQGFKRLTLPVRGTLGFEKAEVTAGGVTLDEVDSRTMESKKKPGLYFAGEVLDLDGWIGGYNFQSAWSTGWLAGGRI